MDHINHMHQTPSSHILAFYAEYEPFVCNGNVVDVEAVIEWEDEWEDCPRSAFNRLFPTHLTPEEVCPISVQKLVAHKALEVTWGCRCSG